MARTHNLQIFWATPFVKLQNDTNSQTVKNNQKWDEKFFFFGWGVAVLPSAWKIVGMTILQALDKKTTPQPKKTSFSFHFFIVFNRLTVVIIWRSETGVHTYIGRASKLPQCCIKRATDADESMSVFLEQHERLSCTFSRSEFSLCFSQQSFRESYKKIWTVTNAYTRHLFIYKNKTKKQYVFPMPDNDEHVHRTLTN